MNKPSSLLYSAVERKPCAYTVKVLLIPRNGTSHTFNNGNSRSAESLFLSLKGKIPPDTEGLYAVYLDGEKDFLALEMLHQNSLKEEGRNNGNGHNGNGNNGNGTSVLPDSRSILKVGRDILKVSILIGASSVLLVHNYPDNNHHISSRDIQLARHLIKCSLLLEMELLDYFFSSNGSFYSLREVSASSGLNLWATQSPQS